MRKIGGVQLALRAGDTRSRSFSRDLCRARVEDRVEDEEEPWLILRECDAICAQLVRIVRCRASFVMLRHIRPTAELSNFIQRI